MQIIKFEQLGEHPDAFIIWPRYIGRDKGCYKVRVDPSGPFGPANVAPVIFADREAAEDHYADKHPFDRDFRVVTVGEYLDALVARVTAPQVS